MSVKTALIIVLIFLSALVVAYPGSPFHGVIVVSSDYLDTHGYGGERRLGVHRGIDCYAKNYYGVIRPIADGVVTRIGIDSIYGKYVEIRHEDEKGTYYSFYAHGKLIFNTASGEVTTNTPIMIMGSTGYSDSPHLHLEIYRYIDGVKVWEDPKYHIGEDLIEYQIKEVVNPFVGVVVEIPDGLER